MISLGLGGTFEGWTTTFSIFGLIRVLRSQVLENDSAKDEQKECAPFSLIVVNSPELSISQTPRIKPKILHLYYQNEMKVIYIYTH